MGEMVLGKNNNFIPHPESLYQWCLDLIYIMHEVLAFVSHPASCNRMAALEFQSLQFFLASNFKLFLKIDLIIIQLSYENIFRITWWRHKNQKYLYS